MLEEYEWFICTIITQVLSPSSITMIWVNRYSFTNLNIRSMLANLLDKGSLINQ